MKLFRKLRFRLQCRLQLIDNRMALGHPLPFRDMLFNFAWTLWKWGRGGFRLSARHVRGKRLATCRACLHFDGRRCALCGCYMVAKTALANAKCPRGHW